MQLDGPILDKIKIDFDENTDFSTYPFSLNIIANLKEITFPTQVTFFIGENGAGKSTILESIATKVGFGKEGGSKNINFNTADDVFYSDVKSYLIVLHCSGGKSHETGTSFVQKVSLT